MTILNSKILGQATYDEDFLFPSKKYRPSYLHRNLAPWANLKLYLGTALKSQTILSQCRAQVFDLMLNNHH